MKRLGRDAPLPLEMQGRWVDVEEPTSELLVDGSEIICFGQRVAYDYKLVGLLGGALCVTLKIDDEASEDAFQRANITGLVIAPGSKFFAFNVKFGCEFERAKQYLVGSSRP